MRFDRIFLTLAVLLFLAQISHVIYWAYDTESPLLKTNIGPASYVDNCDGNDFKEGRWSTNECSLKTTLCSSGLGIISSSAYEVCLKKRQTSIRDKCSHLPESLMLNESSDRKRHVIRGFRSDEKYLQDGQDLSDEQFEEMIACRYGFEKVGFESSYQENCLSCRVEREIEPYVERTFGWKRYFKSKSNFWLLLSAVAFLLLSIFGDLISKPINRWLNWIKRD